MDSSLSLLFLGYKALGSKHLQTRSQIGTDGGKIAYTGDFSGGEID